MEDLQVLQKEYSKPEFEATKILVTGAAGFLGSWITDLLILAKAEVTIIDNFSTGLLENINHINKKSNFKLIKKDITEIILSDLEEYNTIFHLASRPSPDDYQQNPVETLLTCSKGTEIMLDAARKFDSKIIITSTSEVYGDPRIIPTPETYWGNVNPIGVRSCYDEGKRYGEALIVAYQRQYGIKTVILRIHNTYGPRLRAKGTYGRAVSRFINQALNNQDITVYGDGKQTRSFAYITDTIKGIIKAATTKKAINETINIGNTKETTIIELGKTIKKLTNSNSKITYKPLPPDDPKRRSPDIRKAKEILGWTPEVNLETGLQKTINWFKTKKERS
jgi:UDP-glucuronate decarboxylase|tara:strand:+ start:8478 stop:9485 length:1008 start_codon:yes stop_codon:yes gene_type:complete